MQTSENILRVGQIRRHLEDRQVSPEVFAKEVQLSHMTIRRWLKKKDNVEIPEKYSKTLKPVLTNTPMVEVPQFSIPGALARMSVSEMMGDLEKNGRDYGKSVETLERDTHAKLKGARLDRIFADYCKRLIRAIRSPKTPLRVKCVCVGALLYFISPIDLIPDHIPVVGYLDDLAVLSIAVNMVAGVEIEETPDKTVIARFNQEA